MRSLMKVVFWKDKESQVTGDLPSSRLAGIPLQIGGVTTVIAISDCCDFTEYGWLELCLDWEK